MLAVTNGNSGRGPMSLRHLIAWVVCSSLMCTITLRAQSPPTTVPAGQDFQVLQTKQKIEIKTKPVRGVASVASAGTGADQINTLIYKANDTSERATDQFDYTLDNGAPQMVSLAIEPNQLQLKPKAYQDIFQAIFLLFMLAVVLESALAVLFNWRPFVETFNARAVRPLVAFVVAYSFVTSFQLDLMTSIVNSATSFTYPPGLAGKVLTALVLAGGSDGVNNILVALGYRQKKTPETVVPKPPPGHAWLAVRLERRQAVGPVEVYIGTPPAANALPPLVGVIHGNSKPGLRYFFSDPGRFPGYGGHQVPADANISVEVRGVDGNHAALTRAWGPHTVAGGAIIDLDLSL